MDTELSLSAISHQIAPISLVERLPWFGIRTLSNHERVAFMVLRGKGYEPYLPLYSRQRRRAEVVDKSEHALFPGYVFCRFDAKKRLPILMTTGVISVVGFGKEPHRFPTRRLTRSQS